MSERLNMTGFWVGVYRYNQPFLPEISFISNLDETDGALSGFISEPNVYTKSSERLSAFVRGNRSGRAVQFAKVYDGSSDFAHRVDYSGMLSQDGLICTGRWILPGLSGPFHMQRTDTQAELLDVEAEQIEVVAK
jgi:hypothetical protein